jgi:predicted AAA+ superfamily ATPase
MKVRRDTYLEELKSRMHNGLVKILTGIRRSGKSYLLSVLFKEYLLEQGVKEDHIVEIPLDRDDFRGLRDAIRLGEFIRSKIKHDGLWTYVFIDEIQLTRKVLPPDVDVDRIAPEDRDGAYVTFYDTLNGLRQIPYVDVYVTGSNSKMLSKDIDTNFADRGNQIRVHPFSFAEYCDALNPTDKNEAFGRYLIWGGMPLAVAEENDRKRARYLKGLFSEVYLNDIVKRHRLRGDAILSCLADVLSSSIGSLTNLHKLRDTVNSLLKENPSDHTIAEYAEHLEDAFLFSEAKRWDVKGKKYFDYPLKYYCEDPGLRNARLDFRDVEPSHMMENVVFNELAARGCQVDVGVVQIAGRQHEIDFVVNRAPGKLYIQVALELPTEEKRRQELLPLRKSDDFFRKMLIVRGYDPMRFTSDGIVEVGVIPFLLDPSVLDRALSDA